MSGGGTANKFPAGKRVRVKRVFGHGRVGETVCPGEGAEEGAGADPRAGRRRASTRAARLGSAVSGGRREPATRPVRREDSPPGSGRSGLAPRVATASSYASGRCTRL